MQKVELRGDGSGGVDFIILSSALGYTAWAIWAAEISRISAVMAA